MLTSKALPLRGPAVRAVIGGYKTQGRIPFKLKVPRRLRERDFEIVEDMFGEARFSNRNSVEPGEFSCAIKVKSTMGMVGDTLWVQETWTTDDGDHGREVRYKATDPDPHSFDGKWRSSTQMREADSCLHLQIVGVRAECLHSILGAESLIESTWPTEDAVAMGYGRLFGGGCFYRSFVDYWNGSFEHEGLGYAKKGLPWSSNPWTWVIDFKVLPEKPVDIFRRQ